jgi:NAD(P)-dependent dehydrogenase (short-subunit alcohol dehydrogenase family)
MGHRGVTINFEDLMFEKTEIHDTSMSGNVLYQQSKLLNILFGQELRRRLEKVGADIKVYICCPGIVKTKISRNLDLPWFTSLVEPILGFIFKTPHEVSSNKN